MICAKAAIVGAAVNGFCIEMQRHFAWLIIIANIFIIFNISCDQDFLKAMFAAVF
jgi:hypothetical protein